MPDQDPAGDLRSVRARILELHPYEVPEILAFTVDDGSPAYLDWLHDATTGPES